MFLNICSYGFWLQLKVIYKRGSMVHMVAAVSVEHARMIALGTGTGLALAEMISHSLPLICFHYRSTWLHSLLSFVVRLSWKAAQSLHHGVRHYIIQITFKMLLTSTMSIDLCSSHQWKHDMWMTMLSFNRLQIEFADCAFESMIQGFPRVGPKRKTARKGDSVRDVFD